MIEATKAASTDAFRLALLVSAVLLAVGAAVNRVGLGEADATATDELPATESPPEPAE